MLLLLSGCNHLFYHPDYEIRATPKALNIPYKEQRLKLDEDTSLHVWHMSAGVNSHGTVIHFHGNAENMTTHFLFVSWLVKHGYDVVTFDYRGYGQSSGIPTREGLVQDGAAVINWLRKLKKSGTASKDIFIFGQSLGGAVAIPAVIAAGQENIRAVVVDSTFASYREITRDRLGTFFLTWPLQYPLSYLVSDDLSPVDHVKQLDAPLLVVHGIRDHVVPIEFGRRLFNEARPERREFWEVELSGHTSGFFAESTPYKPRLTDYLCKKSSTPLDCQPSDKK